MAIESVLIVALFTFILGLILGVEGKCPHLSG